MKLTAFTLEPLAAPPQFHHHPFFEIHLVTGGTAVCEYSKISGLGTKKVHLKKGDLIVIFPGERHRFVPVGPTPFVQLYLGFLPSPRDGVSWRGFPAPRVRGRVFHPGVSALAEIQKVVSLWGSENTHQKRLALFEWGVFLSRVFQDDSKTLGPRVGHPLAAELLAALVTQVRGPFSIGGFAREHQTDPSRLNRLFRQAYGEGPSRLFQKMKLEGALAYLKSHGGTIVEAAQQFGYANAFHLSRQCRLFKGVSPRVFLGRSKW